MAELTEVDSNNYLFNLNQDQDEVEEAEHRGYNFRSDTNWVILQEFKSEVELEAFILSYTHKMTSTHGNQEYRCIFHSLDRHQQSYGYYKCTSSKCYKEQEDACSLQFRANKRYFDQSIRLYQVGEHSNKYVSEIDNKTPYATMKILIKRRAEGVFFLFSNFFMSLI